MTNDSSVAVCFNSIRSYAFCNNRLFLCSVVKREVARSPPLKVDAVNMARPMDGDRFVSPRRFVGRGFLNPWPLRGDRTQNLFVVCNLAK